MSDPVKMLRELAEPWAGGEKVKVAIDRAARLAGLKYWRAFDIWYGKARCVQDFEVEAISSALERKRELEARNELQNLRTRLARLESLLVQRDEDFHRHEVDFVWEAVRRSR